MLLSIPHTWESTASDTTLCENYTSCRRQHQERDSTLTGVPTLRTNFKGQSTPCGKESQKKRRILQWGNRQDYRQVLLTGHPPLQEKQTGNSSCWDFHPERTPGGLDGPSLVPVVQGKTQRSRGHTVTDKSRFRAGRGTQATALQWRYMPCKETPSPTQCKTITSRRC